MAGKSHSEYRKKKISDSRFQVSINNMKASSRPSPPGSMRPPPGSMRPPAAAEGADAKVAVNSDSDTQDNDELEVYMLAEARDVYDEERPPFVVCVSRKANRLGARKVVVLANDDGSRPDAGEGEKAEIVRRAYEVTTAFWTLDLDGARFIVRAKGAGLSPKVKGGAAYRIWLGPVAGFGERAVAFSDRALRDEVSAQADDEVDEAEQDASHARPEENSEACLVDASQQSPGRDRHPCDAKDKGQAWTRLLAAARAESDRSRQAKREERRLRALRRQQNSDAQARVAPNESTKASHPSLPTPPARRSPSSATGESTPAPRPVKRRRSPAADDTDDRARKPARGRPRHPSRSPSIIELAHSTALSIDRYQQSHTTLHVSLSTNDYGAVPVYLRSCMTVEAFFTSALSAWGLEGKEANVAAVTVRFDWLQDDGPMVMRREVRDSFQKMLETIAEAPVWRVGDAEGAGGRKGCEVRVKIFMREV